MQFSLLAVSAITLLLVLSIRRRDEGEPLKTGDIVVYVNRGERDKLNNLITIVLDTFPAHGTVLIRGRGNTPNGSTTSVVPLRRLTKLPVDRNYDLQVPSEPVPSGSMSRGPEDTNGAPWTQIPISWFAYVIPRQKQKPA